MQRLLAISLILFSLAGPAAAQPWAPSSGGELQPVQNCQIIARINGRAVLASEVLWQANLIIEDNKDKIPPEKIDEVRKMLMQNQLAGLLDLKLIYGDFVRETAGRADMKSIEENLAGPFEEGEIPKLREMLGVETTDELSRQLVALGTTLGERRTAFQERAIASQWIQQKVNVAEPNHADLIARYFANAEQYDRPARVKWEELMVKFSSYPSGQAARNAVAELGNQVWPQYQAAAGKPEPVFTEVAKQKSEGFTAAKGGVHDWTSAGALRDQQIDAALFSLPVGTMSPILESELGYHIVRVLEREQAGRTPFDEVQDDLRAEIKSERGAKQTEEFIKSLRQQARVWTVFTGDTTAEAFLKPPGGGGLR